MLLEHFALFVSIIAPALATVEELANCDPSRKDEHCPPDPAFARKTSFDFNKASWNEEFAGFWSVDDGSSKDKRRVSFDTDGKGVGLGPWEEGQAPSLTSNKYLFFGKVSVEIQAARGRGVITSIVLKSDSGDEIDWEILGAYDKEAQTNYFYDGDAIFNRYNDTYKLDAPVFSRFHTYTVEWTESKLVFSIDGTQRKTRNIGEISRDKWPQAPMFVKLVTWTVEKDNDDGLINWAGGLPEWDDAPFKAYYRKIEIEDYTGYCKEVYGPVEYAYDERTHGWEQVKVKGCKEKLPSSVHTANVPTGGATTTEGSSHTSSGGGDEALPEETGGDEDGVPALKRASWASISLILVSWVFLA